MNDNQRHTFVCFDCKMSARRSTFAQRPLCQGCGKVMRGVGYFSRVPKRTDKKGWDGLLQFLLEDVESNRQSAARHKQYKASSGWYDGERPIAANTHPTVGRQHTYRPKKYSRAQEKHEQNTERREGAGV